LCRLSISRKHRRRPIRKNCAAIVIWPPHRSDERQRSFLNMHSRYISCLTCHFRPDNVSLDYRWLNFNQQGSEHKAKRIAPFYKDEAVPVFNGHKMAEQLARDWQHKSLLEKAKIKARLHAPLSEEGPGCLQCHDREKNMLDLPALAYSEKETEKLQQHSIPRFFDRFRQKRSASAYDRLIAMTNTGGKLLLAICGCGC